MGDISTLGQFAGGISQGWQQQQQMAQKKELQDLLTKKAKLDLDLLFKTSKTREEAQDRLKTMFQGQQLEQTTPGMTADPMYAGPPEPGAVEALTKLRMGGAEGMMTAMDAGYGVQGAQAMFPGVGEQKYRSASPGSTVFNEATGEPTFVAPAKPGTGKELFTSPAFQDRATGLWYQKGSMGSMKPTTPPKDKAGAKETDPSKIAAAEQTLRKEYISESKFFQSIKDSYNTITANATAATAAGDMGLIFAIMKMFDPTSVVRESEYATAQQAASIIERAKAAAARVATGEKLSETQRKDFVETAGRVYRQAEGDWKKTHKYYGDLANSYGYPAERIVRDYSVEGPLTAEAYLQKMGQ